MIILDYLGMASIFIGIVYIGYRSAKTIENSSDFLLAGRGLNKIQASLSLAASEFGGGGLIGACAACYTMGLAGIWWNWAAVLPFIFVGIYIAPRLRDLELNTVPEYFEKRYNAKSRILATILQIIATVPGITAQLTVATVAVVTITGWDYNLCLGITTMFVLMYTMGGGLVAEVANDVFLFIVIIVSLILALCFSTVNVGGITNLLKELPKEYLNIGSIGFWEPFSWMLLCLFDYATSQYVVQRAFSAKNPKTARFAFLFTGLFFIVVGGIVALIGLNIVVLLPNLTDPNQGYSLLINKYLPHGIAGLALGGIVAAAFSTVDSSLMSTTTLFINDIYKPYINKNASDKRVLLVSRVVVFVSCAISILLASVMNNIIDLIYISGLFYGPAVFFPLILGMFSKTISGKAAFISIIVAVFGGILSEFLLYGRVSGLFGILPSNLVSAVVGVLVLLIMSIFEKHNKKRVGIV